jgi:hypothetical protein
LRVPLFGQTALQLFGGLVQAPPIAMRASIPNFFRRAEIWSRSTFFLGST